MPILGKLLSRIVSWLAKARKAGAMSKPPPPTVIETIPTGSFGPFPTQQAASSAPPTSPGDPLVTLGEYSFNLRAIDRQTDAAYQQLHAEATSSVIDWLAFGYAATALVSSGPSDTIMDDFFRNATGIWQVLVAAGRFEHADGFWDGILTAVESAETSSGTTVHKGAGYYYWASNALITGDLEDGMLRLQKAVAEDRRRLPAGTTWPTTPAARLATLEASTSSTHPLSWWAGVHVVYLDQQLADAGSTLRTTDLRTRFLLKTDTANAVMFVHAIAGLRRLAGHGQSRLDTIFGAQVLASYMFRLTLVLERAIAAKSGVSGLMKDQVVAVSKILGEKLGVHVGEVNDGMKKTPGPTLVSLIARTLAWNDGSTPTDMDTALAVAYGLRNLAAHTADVPAVVCERSAELLRQILRAFEHCIAAYYP